MPVTIRNTKIQVKSGLQEDLPQLDRGEFGWSVDTSQLYIGNGTLAEGAPVEGNTEILTANQLNKVVAVYTGVTGNIVQVSVNLSDSVLTPTSTTITLTSSDPAGFVDYSIVRNGLSRSGEFEFALSNGNISYSDSYAGDSLGVVLSAAYINSEITILYTTTSTGFPATLTVTEQDSRDSSGQGVPGTAASIAIGNITAQPTGTTPAVTNTGTSTNAVLNFALPQGPDGLSAYQVWLAAGNTGSEDDYIASQKGATGPALPFAGNYASGTTYSIGQVVTESGVLYLSLLNGNTGNDPATSTTKWANFFTFPAMYPFGRSRYASYDAYGDSITAGCCPAPARLTSGTLTVPQQAVSQFTGITNGSMTVNANGNAYTLSGLNFTACAGMADVATVIRTAMLAQIPGVNFQYNNGIFSYPPTSNPAAYWVFDCGSSVATYTSTVDYFTPTGSGTDITTLLQMTAATGAVIRPSDTNTFAPYATLTGAALGLVTNNHGESGWTSFMVLGLIYQQSVAKDGKQAFSYAIGTNDNFVGGGGVSLGVPFAPCFKSSIMAAVAWLTIPDGDKQQANTWATGAGWSNSTGLQTWGFGQKAAAQNTTATTYVSGEVLYLGYSIVQSGGGTFKVTIDGVDTGVTYSCEAPAVAFSQGNTQTWAGQLLAIPCSYAGIHQVTVTVTSSTGEVYIDWVAGNDFVQAEDGPTLAMGGTLRQGIGDPYYDSSTGQCDSIIRTVVQMFRSYGHNVRFVPVRTAQGGMAINSYLNTDFTHPNQEGHMRIASLYLNAFTFLADSGVRYPGDINTAASAQPLEPLIGTSLSVNAGIALAATLTNGGNPAILSAARQPYEVYSSTDGASSDFGLNMLTAGGGSDHTQRGFIGVTGYGAAYPVYFGRGETIYGYIDPNGNMFLKEQLNVGNGMVLNAGGVYQLSAPTTTVAPYEIHANCDGTGGTNVDSGVLLLSAGGGVDLGSRAWLTLNGYNGSVSAPAGIGVLFGVGNQRTMSIGQDCLLNIGQLAGSPGGLIMQDTVTSQRYKIQMVSGVLTATAY